MDDDIEPHPCVTETAKFVALACVASRLIRLNAQAVHMPGQRIDLAGEALRARIEANLARQDQPELSAIHLVRATRDLTAAMPRFVTAFFENQFAT